MDYVFILPAQPPLDLLHNSGFQQIRRGVIRDRLGETHRSSSCRLNVDRAHPAMRTEVRLHLGTSTFGEAYGHV